MTPERLYEILGKFARSQGIELNRDRAYVMEIMAGLLKNEERFGYRSCPCRLAFGVKERDADIICPCLYRDPDIKDFGSCYCGLYVSSEWNIEAGHRKVPERRPPEKMP